MATHRRKFEFHPDAIEYARLAVEWYAERSERAVENFKAELRRAEKQVLASPQTWGKYFHNTQCFRFANYPYGLVYIECGQSIIGLAVVHFKRKPGYWNDRLEK